MELLERLLKDRAAFEERDGIRLCHWLFDYSVSIPVLERYRLNPYAWILIRSLKETRIPPCSMPRTQLILFFRTASNLKKVWSSQRGSKSKMAILSTRELMQTHRALAPLSLPSWGFRCSFWRVSKLVFSYVCFRWLAPNTIIPTNEMAGIFQDHKASYVPSYDSGPALTRWLARGNTGFRESFYIYPKDMSKVSLLKEWLTHRPKHEARFIFDVMIVAGNHPDERDAAALLREARWLIKDSFQRNRSLASDSLYTIHRLLLFQSKVIGEAAMRVPWYYNKEDSSLPFPKLHYLNQESIEALQMLRRALAWKMMTTSTLEWSLAHVVAAMQTYLKHL